MTVVISKDRNGKGRSQQKVAVIATTVATGRIVVTLKRDSRARTATVRATALPRETSRADSVMRNQANAAEAVTPVAGVVAGGAADSNKGSAREP